MATRERFGAWAGITFVVGFLIAGAITGEPPRPDDSDEAVRDFFLDTKGALLLQSWLCVAALPLLLAFAVAVRARMTAVAHDRSMGDLFVLGVGVNAALVTVVMALQVGTVHMADRLAPETVRVLFDAGTAVVALFGFIVALTAGVFISAVRADRRLPSWTAWLAMLALVVNLVGTAAVFRDEGAFSLEGALGVFGPYVTTMAWYLGVAIAMLRSPST